MFDKIIHCGYLLTMADANPTIKSNQYLAIQGSKIVAIGPWQDDYKHQCQEFIDASDDLVMPGLINAHSHLPMTLLRGLAEDQPFAKWLHETILPIEAGLVDPEFVSLGTQLGLLESLQGGVTTVADMYYFQDTIAKVVDEVGMRGLMIETIMDFPTPDNKESNGQDYFILDTLLEQYHQHERIKVGIGPHAPYTCSDKTLTQALAYAQRHQLPIHIHVAETAQEVQDSLAQYQLTPVERLHRLGLSQVPCMYAHGVHLSPNDMELLAETKVSVIYNPESNMKLSSGIAPIPQLLQAGITVAIGTDGPASNNDLAILNELDTGLKLQRLMTPDAAIKAYDLLQMATIQGAKALGIADEVGSLAVGKYADCIILDLNFPALRPRYDIPSALVNAAGTQMVKTVICHGRVLVANRQVTTLDVEKLYFEVDKYAHKICSYLK